MSKTRETAASDAWRKVWRRSLPPGGKAALAFAPSGERLAAGVDSIASVGHTAGSLTVFSASAGDVVRQIVDDWDVHFLAFSADSRFLVTSESRFHQGAIDERRVRILNADTLEERCRYAEALQCGPSDDLAFSQDGAWVSGRADELLTAAGHQAPTVYMFNAMTGAQRWRREFPNIFCLALLIHPK
jgi:outer membrane protein assembly factor BamB